MKLNVRIDLNPKCPCVSIYKDLTGFGFSEEETYLIQAKYRVRKNYQGRSYNASFRLATKLYNKLLSFSSTKYVREKPTVLIPILDEKADEALTAIREFISSEKLYRHAPTSAAAS